MKKRAQTANDYLIGIIIILITITTVFGFFPSIFEPFEEPVDSDEETMADNLASEAIDNFTVAGNQRTLNFTALDDALTQPRSYDINKTAGLQTWRNWNITIRTDSGVLETGGDNLDDYSGPTATTIRFIQLTEHAECNNGCRLVVRVW